LSEKTLDELAEMNLLMVGLPPDAGAKFLRQLSGGMIKRAALARALALEPKLLFSTSRRRASIRFPPQPSMSYCCIFIRNCGSRLS